MVLPRSSDRLTPERRAELVVLMRAGDSDARNALIVAHMGLALKAAGFFWWHRALDDITSATLMRLVDAVDSYPKDGDLGDGITQWIWVKVSGAAMNAAEAERALKRSALSLDATALSRKFKTEDELNLEYSFEPEARPTGSVLDAWEELAGICTEQFDMAILSLKSQGMSGKEVAERIGLSPSYVSKALSRLETAWRKRCGR